MEVYVVIKDTEFIEPKNSAVERMCYVAEVFDAQDKAIRFIQNEINRMRESVKHRNPDSTVEAVRENIRDGFGMASFDEVCEGGMKVRRSLTYHLKIVN
jgi:hypothetical protein